ncbi:MAG: porin family protein, partial [Bacteroidales bacterium]|nr:porin family protein [Bacteroidales bacterium]
MKSKTNFIKILRMMWFSYSLIIKNVILIALILTSIQWPTQAQVNQHSWWFGAAAGANFNFYRSSIQELNSVLISPVDFHKGSGVGLYFAPLMEFHRPNSRWGLMMQAGYDSRKGSFKGIITPCNCPADLSTDLSYITVEPSLRFAPFKSDFYLYGGPRLAFNLNKSFVFEQGIYSDILNHDVHMDMNGDFSNMNKIIISMQIGAGYDIPISSQNNQTQFVLSPFVSFQPHFGQSPRSIETWNATTLRIGAALKFSSEHKIPALAKTVKTIPVKVSKSSSAQIIELYSKVRFSFNVPINNIIEHRIKETFTVCNYVLFDTGSTEIPEQYVDR